MKLIRLILICSTFSLIIIILLNNLYVYPNDHEKTLLNNYFKYSKISTKEEILKFQNKVIEDFRHEYINNKKAISIDSIIFYKKGYCYDRSLLMQKYFLSKNFRVRPIYIYRNVSNNRIIDFLKYNLNSHNLFEVYFNNSWYVIRTNSKMTKLETLDEYLHSSNTFS